MKTRLIYFISIFLVLLVSCDPIENRDKLGSVLSENELAFDIIQEPTGSNTVRFVSKTSGIIPYFDWGSGFSNKESAEAYLPFAGTYTVTYTAYCAGGSVSVSKEFTVSDNDEEYFKDPAWNLLTNGTEGKTWVFATDVPSYDGKIWGNGGYLNSPAGPGWWGRTVADAKDDNIDVNSELYFDLDGGANVKTSENGKESKGTFDLNLEDIKDGDGNIWAIGNMELAGTTIPHGISQNENQKTVYKFNICTLNENELVLSYNTKNLTSSGTEAWFWVFKRKGYNY